jgi:signal transduction histidine kinase
MNSRVKEIGGKVEIDSKVDIGTIIKIKVPYN